MQEIISDLYFNKDLDDCIRKVVAEKHREDFKQELFLILLENPERLTEAHANNKLVYYIVRIVLNLCHRTRNPIYKRYFDKRVVYNSEMLDSFLPCESPDFDERIKKEQKETAMITELENLDTHFGTFYYRELVNLVAKDGSMRATGRRLGIPVCSISRAVKKVRNHLTR